MQPSHPGSLPQVNVLSCPGCGAPLDAPAITGQVRCQYCGRTVNVSRPAPGPVPSPRLPAPPAPVTRTGGGGRATLLAAVLVPALAVGGWAVVSLGVFAARIASPALRSMPPAATTARSEAAIPVARLDQLGMDRTLDQVATWAGDARFAVEPSRLQVRLSDSRFASLSLSWPRDDPSHVERIGFMARQDVGDDDPAVQALRATFGQRLRREGLWYAYDSNGAHVAVLNQRLFEFNASSSDDSNWKRRVAALWEVARAVANGRPVTLDAGARRDWLGTGYPMAALASIDPTVEIDASRPHLLRLFPGISWRRSGVELEYNIPLDHSWFERATLTWRNEKGSRLSSVHFFPAGHRPAFPQQHEIRDCLAQKLGSPEDRETDHLANEHAYSWGKYSPRAYVNLSSHLLSLELRTPSGVGPFTLAGVTQTLAGCQASE